MSIEEELKEEKVKIERKSNARRVINFRISEEEEMMLIKACNEAGVNRSVFFRNAIRNGYEESRTGSISSAADELSKTIAPTTSKIVKHPFAKLVMKKGIDVELDGGESKTISNLSDLFDFLQEYVFTKS